MSVSCGYLRVLPFLVAAIQGGVKWRRYDNQGTFVDAISPAAVVFLEGCRGSWISRCVSFKLHSSPNIASKWAQTVCVGHKMCKYLCINRTVSGWLSKL